MSSIKQLELQIEKHQVFLCSYVHSRLYNRIFEHVQLFFCYAPSSSSVSSKIL